MNFLLRPCHCAQQQCGTGEQMLQICNYPTSTWPKSTNKTCQWLRCDLMVKTLGWQLLPLLHRWCSGVIWKHKALHNFLPKCSAAKCRLHRRVPPHRDTARHYSLLRALGLHVCESASVLFSHLQVCSPWLPAHHLHHLWHPSPKHFVLADEKTLPPVPVMLMLSTEGLLCPFALLNSNPGIKQLVSAPTALAVDGERLPKPGKQAEAGPTHHSVLV